MLICYETNELYRVYTEALFHATVTDRHNISMLYTDHVHDHHGSSYVTSHVHDHHTYMTSHVHDHHGSSRLCPFNHIWLVTLSNLFLCCVVCSPQIDSAGDTYRLKYDHRYTDTDRNVTVLCDQLTDRLVATLRVVRREAL